MKPQAFIFIGRSGCGKGTQVKLLTDVLAKKFPQTQTMYISTGAELREFIKGDTYTEKKSKEIYNVGGLQPEFLAVGMWVNRFFRDFNGTQNVIMDGMPRKLHEAGVLHSCLEFYEFDKPWVINIEISPEESAKRLLARKRFDDNDAEIKKRLEWYETDVVPTLTYYDGNPKYNFLKIFGERPVEEIHADIIAKLNI